MRSSFFFQVDSEFSLPSLRWGKLDAPFLWRTAAVMRNGVMSRINLTRRPASCNPRMAVSLPGPAPYHDPCLLHSLRHRLLGSRSSRRLGGRTSLLGSRRHRPKTKKSPPRKCRDSNDGVVETCLNMNHPLGVFSFRFRYLSCHTGDSFFLCAVLAITKEAL
jgi:hypothetical protein